MDYLCRLQISSSFNNEHHLPLGMEMQYFYSISLFVKKYFYLFLEGAEGKERGRETLMCGCLLRAPSWVPGPQPWHVP